MRPVPYILTGFLMWSFCRKYSDSDCMLMMPEFYLVNILHAAPCTYWCVCVCACEDPVVNYHGGQDGQEERCCGNIASTLGKGGNKKAKDNSNGPGGDGVERCHLSTKPAGQARLLNTHTVVKGEVTWHHSLCIRDDDTPHFPWPEQSLLPAAGQCSTASSSESPARWVREGRGHRAPETLI